MNIQWLEPWGPINDAELARVFEEELAREMAADHPLAKLPLKAIGQHAGTADFLFSVDDGSGRLAIVHLTWTARTERPPWPQSMLFANEADWIENGMRPDHDETVAGTNEGEP